MHLTLKILVPIQCSFTFRHCMTSEESNPRYLITTDDDTVIDFEKLKEVLENEISDEHNIGCPSVFKNFRPWRHFNSPIMGKWAVSFETYDRPFLPDFCYGIINVMSPKVGHALAEAARLKVRGTLVNDVFLTGMYRVGCRRKY